MSCRPKLILFACLETQLVCVLLAGYGQPYNGLWVAAAGALSCIGAACLRFLR